MFIIMSIYMHSKIKTKNTLGEKIWIYCAKQQIAHINNQHTVYHIVCLTEKRNDNTCTVFYTMVFDGRKKS